jgi:uncharacterized protein YkwD
LATQISIGHNNARKSGVNELTCCIHILLSGSPAIKKLSYIGIFALFVLAACSRPVDPVTTQAAFKFAAGDFQTLLNTERKNRGLGPLVGSAKLAAAAQGHAADMSNGAFFSHVSSNGDTLGRRTRAQGYGYCWVAENISWGRTSEAEVFARWMASPGHRKNMMARDPTQYGLAVAPGNYRVLVLGRPGC